MSPQSRKKNWVVKAALVVGVYLCGYPVLWATREDTIFAMTERGCIQKKSEVAVLRFQWMDQRILRVPITAIYWPINALLFSGSE